MTGVLMGIMIVLVALVVDIGHTRLVQRQLQAGVDAAALAAAQELPDGPAAVATANEYSPTPGDKNSVNTVDNATTSVITRCIPSIPGCNTRYSDSNAVTVTSTSRVPTFFARIIGVNSLTVTAKATACFPCSIRPLDIVLILDRTGSMCDTKDANGKCIDLEAARNGIATFISMMDPKLDRVGLAVTPPATGPSDYSMQDAQPCLQWKPFKPKTDANCTQWTQVQVKNPDSPSDACAAPTSGNNYYGLDAWAPWWQTGSGSAYQGQDRAFYVVSSLSDDDVDGNPNDDYVVKDANGIWDLNPSSPLVSTLACIKSGGSTSYSLAIDEAQHELTAHGRPDVQDVIVFFSDGGANSTQDVAAGYWTDSTPWPTRPCGQGVEASKRLPSDTAVYSIGYNLENQTANSQRCQKPGTSGHQDNNQPKEVCQTWGCTPQEALKAIASKPENFYYTADANQLKTLFQRVAGDVLTNASRLVDNDLPDS
jgi:Putative Flp pilus-assembly TadE/G-like